MSGINKIPVFLLTWNFCLASLYFGANIAAYNSTENVLMKLNGWLDRKDQIISKILISGSMPMGAMLASPLAVIASSIFKGNIRKTSIALDFLAILACIVQLYSHKMITLLIGRFFVGAIIGLNCTFVPTYITEISPVSLRGVTGCMNQLFICSGICISLVVGLILPSKNDLTEEYDDQISWRIVMGFPVIFSMIRMVFLTFGPLSLDAPSSLIKENRITELNSLLHWIYNHESEFEKAKKNFQLFIQNNNSPQSKIGERMISLTTTTQTVAAHLQKQYKQSDSSVFQQQTANPTQSKEDQQFFSYEQQTYNRRFLLGFLLSIGQQLTGINTVMFYSNSIFEQAGEQSNARYYSIILGFVQVFATLAGAILSERTGRRILMLGGTLAIIASLFLIWIFLVHQFFTPCFLSICLYLIAFSLSQGPLVWAYQGEILDRKALQINTCALWFFTFLVVVVFPFLQDVINEASFGIFGGITLVFFFYFTQEFIETSGKSKQQIYADFARAKIPLNNANFIKHDFIQT